MAIRPPVELIDSRYEVGPVMGRGAMGEVRRGRDVRLGREIAVKFLRPDLAADRNVRARFEDEARSAARLSHPAIVTVFDSGEWEGVPFLVMECLPGRTLADELASGPLPSDRVRAIAVDVAGALQAAHDVGVVHRDVKPGNILLTDGGAVKLADFGIAKSTEGLDHTLTGTIVGTPAYLAPECLSGEPATPRSDVYSLGVLLYEALTGDKPFRGDTPIQLAVAIQTSTPAPIADRLPGTDSQLAAVVDRAMAKDPADRPASARELVADLGRALPPTVTPTAATGAAAPATQVMPVDPTTSAPIGAAIPPRSWWQGRRDSERKAIVAGIVAVLLALILLVSMVGDGGSQPPPATVAPTTTTPSSLPEPLDDAINQLEESVQP